MSRVITDQTAFLMEAKDTLKELDDLKAYGERLLIEEKRLEKAIASEKKAVLDSITVTVKKRKEEISASYDKEMSKDQEKLKKIRAKREKAKNQGVKERIEGETAELTEDNRQLQLQIKTLFKQHRVPSFCNSSFYYSLYFTKGIREMLTFLFTILVCFLATPCGIYYFFAPKELIYLVAIYFGTIFIFGGSYFIINNMTKIRHLDALRQGRLIKNMIYVNHKKMKIITNSVKKDKNDAFYDLENFDDALAQLEGQITLTGKRKQEALSNFENVTKNIIADEITGNSQERIIQLEEQFTQTVDQLKETEATIKEQSIYITDNYEVYLGREFLQEEKLDKLIEIISSQQAVNISEAIQYYKNYKNN